MRGPTGPNQPAADASDPGDPFAAPRVFCSVIYLSSNERLPLTRRAPNGLRRHPADGRDIVDGHPCHATVAGVIGGNPVQVNSSAVISGSAARSRNDASSHIIIDIGDIGPLWRTHILVFQHLTAFDAAYDYSRPLDH